MRYTVQEEGNLLEILQKMAPDSSNNTLRSWLHQGRVMVDQRRVCKAQTCVQSGQVVEVGAKVSFIRGSIRVLFEDEHLVVLEKPEGLLSVATDLEKRQTVHAFLKAPCHRRSVYPVHRLDRDTSGVMVFAYSDVARQDLKAQFEKRLVEKMYVAVVEGEMPLERGSWESYLREDDFYYVKSTHNIAGGKRALTDYEVVRSCRQRSLVKLHPKTGRKNQLRVHCSEAGHPIAGDKKYGAKTDPAERMCLHAYRLSFTHPKSRRSLHFESPVPESFFHLVGVNDLRL